MAGLRACESHNLATSVLVILCIIQILALLCHGKARSCYSPPVGQCSGAETLNQFSMDSTPWAILKLLYS